jgi:signal transduction histidine kinase
MGTKAEIIASIEAAKSDIEQALADAATMPDLDWATVRCAAHCLGNYLNITSGCIQLLSMTLADYPDAEVQVWLQALERTTELMIYISRQLTNASAVSEVPLQLEKVDLALMAQRAAAFYETMANNKNLQLICERSGPAPVWADRVALAAVLDNLLSNAVKYSPSGKRVRVRVKVEAGQVGCSVEDEGPGLTPEDQARLFQKGVRLGSTPTGGESSTGFGLFIARRLVERMGGSIQCESAPGQGCKFSFRLPALEEYQSREALQPGS